MYLELTDVINVLKIIGVNAVLIAATAGFVAFIKKIFIAAKIKVPGWTWLIIVMVAGFIIALFEATSFMRWIESGIKNATAASYAYNLWERTLKKEGGS